jgi:hypothetical protein
MIIDISVVAVKRRKKERKRRKGLCRYQYQWKMLVDRSIVSIREIVLLLLLLLLLRLEALIRMPYLSEFW